MCSELLYLPDTHPFDETHDAAAGMRVCLSPNGKCVPAAEKLCSLCRHELKRFDMPNNGWWCSTCQCMLATGMSMPD